MNGVLAQEFGLPIEKIEDLSSYPLLASGITCGVASILARVVGKWPIYVASTSILLITCIWSALIEKNYAKILVKKRRERVKSDLERWERFCFGTWYQCRIRPCPPCPRAEKEYDSRSALQAHLLNKYADQFSRRDPAALEAALDRGRFRVYENKRLSRLLQGAWRPDSWLKKNMASKEKRPIVRGHARKELIA